MSVKATRVVASTVIILFIAGAIGVWIEIHQTRKAVHGSWGRERWSLEALGSLGWISNALRQEIGDDPARIAELSQIVEQLSKRDAVLADAMSPSWLPVKMLDPLVAEEWLVIGQTMFKRNVMDHGHPDEIIAIVIPVQQYSDAPVVFLERQLDVRVIKSISDQHEMDDFYRRLGCEHLWVDQVRESNGSFRKDALR